MREKSPAPSRECVRAVVTLGSPVWGDRRRYTNVWKLYERIARHPVDRPPIPDKAEKPPVPTLAIWSRRDGIVAAPSARGTPETRDKAVEVNSTHMGFAVSKKGTPGRGGRDRAIPERGRVAALTPGP